MYFPQDKQITIHQSRVKYCPVAFPAGFYWYGGNQKGLSKVPQWVQNLLSNGEDSPDSLQASDVDREEEITDVPPSDVITDKESNKAIEEAEVSSGSDGSVSTPEAESTTQQVLDRSPKGPYQLRRHPRPFRKQMEAQTRV